MIDIKDIDVIEYGIYSPEEIKATAVCKLDNKDNFGPGSVYDERMGCLMDTNEPCKTCGLTKNCIGHFGYIELPEPVLHPLFYKMISNMLKCFCKKCNRRYSSTWTESV
jgi:DNA-directed RNA polymerase beta' subunit